MKSNIVKNSIEISPPKSRSSKPWDTQIAKFTDRLLARYSRNVSSASTGAVVE